MDLHINLLKSTVWKKKKTLFTSTYRRKLFFLFEFNSALFTDVLSIALF
jgi:hypothetical protein